MYSKAFLNIIAGIIIWLGCQLFSCISTLISNEIISILLSSVIQIFSTFALLRLYCKKFLNISTTDCRIKFIMPKPIWFYCSFLLPCAVSAAFFLFVPGSFSLNSLECYAAFKTYSYCIGIMLSIICYKSDSVVSSTLVHGIWNLIMVGGIINIGEPNSSAILNYSLNTSSRLLTGGAFGIEASLPAIAGYWCVIIILLLPANKKSY